MERLSRHDIRLAQEQAENDRILTNDKLQKGVDFLKTYTSNWTLEKKYHKNGISLVCAELVQTLFGWRGYYKDITLLEGLKDGDESKYSIIIGIKPTDLMVEFKLDQPFETTIYLIKNETTIYLTTK